MGPAQVVAGRASVLVGMGAVRAVVDVGGARRMSLVDKVLLFNCSFRI
jgi:hypothetical protein